MYHSFLIETWEIPRVEEPGELYRPWGHNGDVVDVKPITH